MRVAPSIRVKTVARARPCRVVASIVSVRKITTARHVRTVSRTLAGHTTRSDTLLRLEFISTGAANRDRAPTDHCVKSPCRNGGECVGLRTTYYCRCKSPFYGTTCDKRNVERNSIDNSSMLISRSSLGIGKREQIDEQESNSVEQTIDVYAQALEDDRDQLRRILADE
jgi:hypothetical protein